MERLFDSFYREGTVVKTKLASGLDTKHNLFPFSFECNDEEFAELLKEHLNKRFNEDKKAVCEQAIKFPTGYFTAQQLTDLKRWLRNNWDGVNSCRK